VDIERSFDAGYAELLLSIQGHLRRQLSTGNR
jgi:hypothetical protein